uniref:FHA domain-containing protein n=1 Tax=Globisporangium ultimum (strain ATCC 200006 / CBS 805.95 / DAOM BR144) TaxID=431595 RepID=K3X911_GLOUD
MKRKQQHEEDDGAEDSNKKPKGGDAVSEVTEPNSVEVVVDVEGFFERECEMEAQKLREHAKARCADLRRELAKSRQAIADSFVTEKEAWLSQQDASDGYDVRIKCVSGPYEGSTYVLKLDSKKHRTCLIGRSTGRKFRAPNGLSMPKDPELSTTHAQLRLEADGRVFFTDLDSTNGSYINDESVEPHEPQALSTTEPNKVSVGGSELLFTFTKRV